jgi:hypothetical protein
MAGRYDWLAAALGAAAGPATTLAAVTIAARTHRTTPRMASDSFSKLQPCQLEIVGLARQFEVQAGLRNSVKGSSRFGNGVQFWQTTCVLNANGAQGISRC